MSEPHGLARQLNDFVHHKARLGVLALLHEVPRASFSQIRDALGQPYGTVARHIGALEVAGYVHVERTWEDRRARSWASISTCWSSLTNSCSSRLSSRADARS